MVSGSKLAVMKRALGNALLAVAVIPSLVLALHAQDVVASGPWIHFRQEHPPLSYEEIPTPFVVRTISGTISYGDDKPLSEAYFEIGLGGGSTLSTETSSSGQFDLRSFRFVGPFVWSAAMRQGTYRFKVTKDGFHSAVGTVVVSSKAPKESVIAIALQPGEGYREEQPKGPPNEELIPLSDATPVDEGPNLKKYPQKYSAAYIPLSLAVGRVRTPEFPAGKQTQWYDIMLQIEKPLPLLRMKCMVGATAGPLDAQDCNGDDPIVRAEWTVWNRGQIVHWGSIPDGCGCAFTDKNIFKLLGSFPAEAGKTYVVQVHFTKDGKPLNVANPHLIVIPRKDMW
jgi:hypothetical protein